MGDSQPLSEQKSIVKCKHHMKKSSNEVILTVVHMPSRSCPYVHLILHSYNHSASTILHPAFFSKATLYKLIFLYKHQNGNFQQVHGIPLQRCILVYLTKTIWFQSFL